MAKFDNVTILPPDNRSIITLELGSDGKIKATSKNLTFEKVLRMTVPFIVSQAKRLCELAKEGDPSGKHPPLTEKQFDNLKISIYDMLNITFANALTEFAPEIEARPDITADALLKAQNDLMKEEMLKNGYINIDGTVNKNYIAKTPRKEN